MHWLYMLKGEISISDKQNQQTLGEELHTQYVTLTDKTNLSVRCGRHLLIGFTVAKDWLTRYMADGLDFLLPYPRTDDETSGVYNLRQPVATTPAMQAEILSLITLPRSARLTQDSAIYQPISELIELECAGYLLAEDSTAATANRCVAVAEAAQIYIINTVKQGGHLPPISEIANHFHVHPDYLSRCHRLRYGMGLKSFMQEKLMQKAYSLLLNGEKVSDVAFKLGYWDISAFGRGFKKFYGVSPSKADRLNNP